MTGNLQSAKTTIEALTIWLVRESIYFPFNLVHTLAPKGFLFFKITSTQISFFLFDLWATMFLTSVFLWQFDHKYMGVDVSSIVLCCNCVSIFHASIFVHVLKKEKETEEIFYNG